MLSGKKILIGVTGSIAAYKTAELVRLFIKAGALVRVVMTACAKDFITPLTLSALSKNPVLSEFVSSDKRTWNNHVEIGSWADLIIIAPASANTIFKMAGGGCDNLLLAVYFSAKCPVHIAPAMDMDMYKHPATVKNIELLESYGNHIIPPETGELASGLFGAGRMSEPAEIVRHIEQAFAGMLPLKNKKALVTAGPTYESMDPVRFIGNHSSGKMGFSIAEELANQGAAVTLIAGPVALKVKHPCIQRVDVVSAGEMYNACMKRFAGCDIAVMAAAVADYRPERKAKHKIKDDAKDITIRLKDTMDILAEMGKQKKTSQILVGFALETENEIINAKAKLKRKNLDVIVVNSMKDKGAGFSPAGGYLSEEDTNKISIIGKDNKVMGFELKPKSEVAKDIVKVVIQYCKKVKSTKQL